MSSNDALASAQDDMYGSAPDVDIELDMRPGKTRSGTSSRETEASAHQALRRCARRARAGFANRASAWCLSTCGGARALGLELGLEHQDRHRRGQVGSLFFRAKVGFSAVGGSGGGNVSSPPFGDVAARGSWSARERCAASTAAFKTRTRQPGLCTCDDGVLAACAEEKETWVCGGRGLTTCCNPRQDDVAEQSRLGTFT